MQLWKRITELTVNKLLNVTGTFQLAGTTVTATAAEINRAAKNSTRVGIAAGSTLTVTQALHEGKIINLDTLAGSTCTLPAATGSGAKYKFLVTVVPTSNSHIVKVANSSDAMIGTIAGVSDDPATVKGWIAGATSDTITLNRGTTGGVSKGEYIEIVDVATNVFAVNGMITQTGTEATPFSATV
jgi:hypothetical protein